MQLKSCLPLPSVGLVTTRTKLFQFPQVTGNFTYGAMLSLWPACMFACSQACAHVCDCVSVCVHACLCVWF